VLLEAVIQALINIYICIRCVIIVLFCRRRYTPLSRL
jgi:hypothetical protein